MLMPVVIARGTISPPRGPQGAQRVEIKYRGHTAVLSEGGSGHWLLTGWKDWVPGAVQKQSHLPHSYAHRTFVGRSDEGAGTPSNIAPIAKEEKTMRPMSFLDVLKMQAEQLNVAPDAVHRGHVGDLARTAELLKRITDAAFHEGEHAE